MTSWSSTRRHSAETTRLAALGDAVGIDVQIADCTDDATARPAVDDGDVDVAVLADGAAILTKTRSTSPASSELATVHQRDARRPGPRQRPAGRRAVDRSDQPRSAPRQPPPVHSINDTDAIDSGRIGAATITNILLFILLQTYGGGCSAA